MGLRSKRSMSPMFIRRTRKMSRSGREQFSQKEKALCFDCAMEMKVMSKP